MVLGLGSEVQRSPPGWVSLVEIVTALECCEEVSRRPSGAA
jgi:hypothetical protein